LGVQEVRWDKGGIEPADDYTFSYENGNADHHLGTGYILVHKDNISPVEREEFVSDSVPYTPLRGR
jgi:hypothetical protein